MPRAKMKASEKLQKAWFFLTRNHVQYIAARARREDRSPSYILRTILDAAMKRRGGKQ